MNYTDNMKVIFGAKPRSRYSINKKFSNQLEELSESMCGICIDHRDRLKVLLLLRP